MIRSIIFDFDGVIADSNNVKTDAFLTLFDRYPIHLKDAIRKFHLQNGGMSRFEKFRFIYANILKEPLPENRFNELCRDFKRLVVDGVIKAPMIDGVEHFLRSYKGRYDMYIISGTPQDEIIDIVKRRKIGSYFVGVYGSPKSKKELIKFILGEYGYSPQEVIFLGDSINDYEGAQGAGIEFVAKISDNLGFDPFPNISLNAKIKTMDEFERYLEKNYGNPI